MRNITSQGYSNAPSRFFIAHTYSQIKGKLRQKTSNVVNSKIPKRPIKQVFGSSKMILKVYSKKWLFNGNHFTIWQNMPIYNLKPLLFHINSCARFEEILSEDCQVRECKRSADGQTDIPKLLVSRIPLMLMSYRVLWAYTFILWV